MENRIGALADVCEALAQNAVNIKAVATEIRDGIGIIKLVTEDEITTRDILKQKRFNFSEYDIIPIKMINRPVSLQKSQRCLRKLALI